MVNQNLCLDRKSNRCFNFNLEGRYKIKDMNAINFALAIIIVFSILFIFISQVSFQMSPSFKLFINEFYYPFIMIALPFAAMNVGFNMWTSQDLTFKQMWKLAMRRNFFNYYFYAIIIATVGIITIAILQSFHLTPNYWNPAWEATYVFGSLTPLQNFSGTGTTFTISMFWFTLCFPFIIKFFNRLNQSTATIFVVFLIIWCCFIGIWNDVFESYEDLQQAYPYWQHVTKYVKFVVIFSFLFSGMYLRKFLTNFNWKICLSLWIGFVLSCIGVETFLNVWYKNYNILIAKNPGGPFSYTATILAYLTFSNVSFKKHQEKTWFKKADKFNKFMNMLVSDIFAVVLVFNHYFDGYLVAHIILNLDVSTITSYYPFYPQARVVVMGYDPNLGWIFLSFSAATSWIFICVGLIRIQCFKNLDKWTNNVKQLFKYKKQNVGK